MNRRLWAPLTAEAVGTFLFRSFGVLLPRGKKTPAWLSTRLGYVAPAVLAGLIVASTFADGRMLVIDARAAGVVVGAAVAFLTRVPPLVAVIAAAATTALVRLA